jgi:hypothetical protein
LKRKKREKIPLYPKVSLSARRKTKLLRCRDSHGDAAAVAREKLNFRSLSCACSDWVQSCREEEEASLDRSWLLALPLAKAGSIEATNLQQEE